MTDQAFFAIRTSSVSWGDRDEFVLMLTGRDLERIDHLIRLFQDKRTQYEVVEDVS